MISLGYFLLGFITVFFGGLIYLSKFDIFDFHIDDEDSDDYLY
tara:strand:- start:508 stop:636 length:129 start_codon:yes stop_codon:yes gene_type:complete